MYALRVQIECAGAGEPCLRHDLGSKRNANLVGSFPEGSGRNNIITKEEEMRNSGAKERAFMAGSFLVFAVLVMLMMRRKLDRVDMVESLKSVD